MASLLSAAALLDDDAQNEWDRGERYACEGAPWLAKIANRRADERRAAANHLRDLATQNRKAP